MARSFIPESIRKHVPVVIATTLTVLFVLLTFLRHELTDDSFLTALEYQWMDAKFRFRGPQLPKSDIVIVGIDDKTLKLGSFRTMRHSVYAQVIDKIAEAKPK